jgi:hypothetical protein
MMIRYALMGLFIIAVVSFACFAFAGDRPHGDYRIEKHTTIEKHYPVYRVHPNLDGVRFLISVDRFGREIERVILPPYPRYRSRVGVDIRL